MKKKDLFKCSKCKKLVKVLCQFSGFSGYKSEEDKWFCEECFDKVLKRNGYPKKEEEVSIHD